MIGPASPVAQSPLTIDERLVLGHVAALLGFTAWAYGGQIGWARELATLWALGGGGALALRLLWRRGAERGPAAREHLRRLWPLLALTVLGALALFTPAFGLGRAETGLLLIERPVSRGLPVVARADLAAPELALWTGLVLSAFNIALGLHHRRAVRALVVFVVVNAAVLAVLGTLQKLLGRQLYFGAVTSPNPSFFATFIYHNHWSAYALLALAAGAALLFQRATRDEFTPVQRSPAELVVIALLAIGATLPLSTSRSGTVLGVALGAAMLGFAAVRASRRRSPHRRAWFLATAVLGAAAIAAIVGLARPAFARRVDQTVGQLAQLRAGKFDAVDDRPAVYRATVSMIAARPLFGWGAASYGTVYPLYRRPETAGLHFEHAHSDWLEALAQRGVVGTALLLFLVAGTLRPVHWPDLPAFSGWLLAGCATVVAYAALEFPFANPAVVFAWWTLLVCAVRFQHLSLVLPPR